MIKVHFTFFTQKRHNVDKSIDDQHYWKQLKESISTPYSLHPPPPKKKKK